MHIYISVTLESRNIFLAFFAMHKCSSGVLGARVYVGHCWSAEMYFGEFGAQRCISGIWRRGHVFLEFGGVGVYFGDACG